MNRIYIFVYAFIAFMALTCAALIYCVSKEKQQCYHDPAEYQLIIEDDYIIVEDYGRTVVVLPIDETCTLGPALIKDNE